MERLRSRLPSSVKMISQGLAGSAKDSAMTLDSRSHSAGMFSSSL